MKLQAQDILPYDAGAKVIRTQGGRVFPNRKLHPKEYMSVDDVAELVAHGR